MIKDYFGSQWRVEELYASPVGPHLDSFVSRLDGLSADIICRYVRGCDHFARWATRSRIELADWDEDLLDRFRRHLSRCQCGRRANGGLLKGHLGGASRLLTHLRELGIVTPREKRPIDAYYRSERRIDQLRATCVGAYLDDFVAEIEGAGHSRESIRRDVSTSDHLARWATGRRIEIASWDESILPRFRRHLSRCSCTKISKGSFIGGLAGAKRLISYLRGRGVIAPAKARPAGFAISERFVDWLQRHRGVAPATIRAYQWRLRPFIAALGEDASEYSVATIRRFVIDEVEHGRRGQMREALTAIRSFLRFLVAEGLIQPGIEHCVPRVPRVHLSSLPRYLEPADLDRALKSCDLTSRIGLRDHAILLLLSRLGFRAGDIMRATLGDLDWKAGTLRVAGKGRREVLLPLPQDVGDAVLAYLERGRPASSSDRVFLTRHAPQHPFPGPASVSNVVRRALERAGVRNPPSRGANLLRHTAATTMLRAGGTLDTVASVLRHRSPQTTAHYAKVDVGMLQQIAQPWPGGVPC